MKKLFCLLLSLCLNTMLYAQKTPIKVPFEAKNISITIKDTSAQGYIDTIIVAFEMRYFRFLTALQCYYGFIDNKNCKAEHFWQNFWVNNGDDELAIENKNGFLEYMPKGKIVFRRYIGDKKLRKINYFTCVIIDREYRYYDPIYWNNSKQIDDKYCKD
jgi:hypothetical protein